MSNSIFYKNPKVQENKLIIKQLLEVKNILKMELNPISYRQGMLRVSNTLKDKDMVKDKVMNKDRLIKFLLISQEL